MFSKCISFLPYSFKAPCIVGRVQEYENTNTEMGVIDTQHTTTKTCTLLSFSVMGVDMLSCCSYDLQYTLSSWLLRV